MKTDAGFAPTWLRRVTRAAFHAWFRLEVRVRCWCSDHARRRKPYSLPPAMLRFRVSEKISAAVFLTVGRGCATHIVNHARRLGMEFCEGMRVLDFGCGCGRTLRWLIGDYPLVEFYGADVDEEAVDWCDAHLPHGHFRKSFAKPPLGYPDAYFDVVYCFSVFTHLDEDLQDLWLGELRRVLRPGGIVLITVHGENAAQVLSDEGRRELRSVGIVHRKSAKLRGIVPEWYHTTWHTREHIVGRLSAMFEEVEYHVVRDGLQDIVAGRRAGWNGQGRRGEHRRQNEPMLRCVG